MYACGVQVFAVLKECAKRPHRKRSFCVLLLLRATSRQSINSKSALQHYVLLLSNLAVFAPMHYAKLIYEFDA